MAPTTVDVTQLDVAWRELSTEPEIYKKQMFAILHEVLGDDDVETDGPDDETIRHVVASLKKIGDELDGEMKSSRMTELIKNCVEEPSQESCDLCIAEMKCILGPEMACEHAAVMLILQSIKSLNTLVMGQLRRYFLNRLPN